MFLLEPLQVVIIIYMMTLQFQIHNDSLQLILQHILLSISFQQQNVLVRTFTVHEKKLTVKQGT